MVFTRVRLLSIALAVGMTGVLAACGSSPHKASTATTPSTALAPSSSQAAPSKTPLLVGSIASTGAGLCNQIDPTHSVARTLDAWAQYVNGHGGIAGHPVHLIQEDDHCDAGQSAAAAKTLVADHVLAIINNTQYAAGWQGDVTAAGIPILCGTMSASNQVCFSNPNMFPSGTTVLTGLYGVVQGAKLNGGTKFGFVYCTELTACQQSVPLLKADSAKLGIDFALSLGVSDTAPNYTAQCEALQSNKVDAVFLGGPKANKFSADCAQQGYHPVYTVGTGTWQNSYVTVPALNRAIGPFGDVPWFANTPAANAFRSAAGDILTGALSPYTAEGAWAGGLLFQYAAAHVSDNPTPKDIYTGLYAISGTTLGGFSPPLTFTPGKPGTVGCYFIISIENGKWVAPQGTKQFCEPST